MKSLDRIKCRKWAPLLICLFLIGSFTMLQSFGAGAAGTEEEKVKAGVFYFDGYHIKDEEGSLAGYGIEFLDMVSQYSHLNFEYTGYDKSWSDMLTMLENGEIDVVTSARRVPGREEKFDFSLPIGRNSTVLYIQADDNRFKAGEYESYDGMKIGIITGSSQNQTLIEFAKEKGFSYEPIEYEHADQLADALQKGDVDALLSSNLRKTENEKSLDTLATENFYAIVRKGESSLLDEINYAIGQMDINEGDWTNTLYYKYYGPVYSTKLDFTEREMDYIQDVLSGKKTITATALGDRFPYSYVEDGKLKGIMPDYFSEVMAVADLPFTMVVPENRDEYYKMADTNGVDVVIDKRADDLASGENPFRGFTTDTYLSVGVARVTRQDFTGEPKIVAVVGVQGEKPVEEGLTGDAEILYCSNREETMQAVLEGKADAAYTYTAQQFVNNDVTNSLKYNMVDAVRFEFQMYVRENCDHELVTILDKCINQMPEDAFSHLIDGYTEVTLGNVPLSQYMRANPKKVFIVVFVILLALVIILVLCLRAGWNKKILRASEESNRELEGQLAIVDALSRDYLNVYALNIKEDMVKVIKMENYQIPDYQKGFREVLSYTAVIKQYVRNRVHPEEREEMAEALSIDSIVKGLKSNAEYTGSYHVLIDGEVHNFQYNYVKIESNRLQLQENFTVLAGFRNIDEMVRKEQEQKEILAEALAEAQYANQAKTTFLNSMSHDIRTPMNAIIGFSALASSHVDNKNLVRDYLDKIMTSGRHLLSLINDVLNMSRIESGKASIEEKEASLSEILHDLKIIVQSDVKAKQLEFYMDMLDVADEMIICDKLRLNQVLLNILSNAIKYTEFGGVVSVRVIQTDDAPEGYASYQFKIKDTGIGMSKEFLKHLFEPFEREQTATISGIQGTGLGLAITKKIIGMMNGTVTVESEVGKGSEFTVKFRFRVANSRKKEERVEELENVRALIVDDDINICTSISKMLLRIGLKPDWTTHGKEAVDRTELAVEGKEPYEVYIIDWSMPDMNGIEVVRGIRQVIGDEARVIILTEYDWADIEEEAREAGGTAFCSKPIFLSELRGILAAPYEEPEEEEDLLEKIFLGKKILLVEDNEINQEIAKAILEEAGLVLDIVSDGTEAVDTMKKVSGDTYDLILMDIQMPVMNGYEATRAIRALEDPIRASVPIVAMTANAFEEDWQMALEAGMNDHVAKPIDVPKLMETIKEIFLARLGEGL